MARSASIVAESPEASRMTMQLPLPLQSEREAVLDEAFQLLRATPTDLLIAWLPVFGKYASLSDPIPPPTVQPPLTLVHSSLREV